MAIATLAVTSGIALVQAMVTDGWEGVRYKVSRLFGRGEPDAKIEQRLAASRDVLRQRNRLFDKTHLGTKG